MTKIKIGLFGFGVVGQGIYEVVRKSKNAHAEIVKICVRDPKKPRKIEVDPSLFTTSVDDILDNQNINLVVEVIDDADAAYNIVKRAMLRGIPVVSGSKTMLAKHLPELIEIQKTRNVALLYDASSCGSIPVIRNLEEYYDNDLLLEVKGILNGSSNYILSRVFDHKDSYANALAQAQALGFAESDPSFDIEGYDSLFKLVIITVHALGTYVAPERIFTYGISTIHDSDIQYAREKNVKIKLVAQVVKVSDEHFTMFVMPEFVTPAKYIYSVDDEYNGVVIRGECYPKKPRKIEVDPSLFTTSVDDILDNQNINLVVEVIDDADAAYNIVKRAMLRGIPVVSGSKTMLAKHLPELIEIQKTRNVALLYDASSCGSIPVIRNLEEYYDNDLLLEVKGILNGSSNYILSRVFDHKDSYANALAQAQALGFAESDPSFDIEGYDSLFKLVIITVHALGTYVAPERIFTYGISTIHDSDIQYAREKNVKIKLVAQVVKVSDEHFTMFVMPEFVTPAKYIYSVDDEYNGVVIRGECYDRQFMFGKGAGSLPTASSILSDIMARLNNYRYEYKKMNYIEKPDYTTDITLKIYARYKETDVQGILNFSKIHEQFISEESNYVIGEIPLRELLEKRSQLSGRDVFLANIPIFFLNRD